MTFQAAAIPDVVEQFDVGGVDSRSNALNMPLNRSLRLLNWVPMQGGGARLRYGYQKMSSSPPTDLNPALGLQFLGAPNLSGGGNATLGSGGGFVLSGKMNRDRPPTILTLPIFTNVIHSMVDYFSWDNGTHFLLYGQSGLLTKFDMKLGTRARVAQLRSGARWNTFKANNHLYLGNGTDMVWTDGDVWRAMGLPLLEGSAFKSVVVYPGVRELLTAEASAVTVTASPTGGTLGVSTHNGIQVYASAFDPTFNDLGPATAVGARQMITGATGSILVGGLPNWSTVPQPWLTLISAADDGQGNAKFITLNQASVTSISRTAGVTTIVTSVALAFVGDVISMEGMDDESFDGVFSILTNPSPNTYTFAQAGLPDVAVSAPTGVVCYKVLSVPNTGGSASISAQNLLQTFLTTADIGLPASTVPTDNPGYQIYVSVYAPFAGGHIGNRFPLGARLQLANRSTIRMNNLPPMSTYNPEWVYLIGRTMDGAQLPYAFIDTEGAFVTAQAAQTQAFIRYATVDFNSELPFRNGVPPAMDKFCRIGDKIYGNGPNSPFIWKSASEANQTSGQLMGVAAEAWDPADVETFPTAEAVTCLIEYDSQAWVFSNQNLAILDESAGISNWQGPYPEGCCGQRAFTRTSHGPFWVSGKRQLCTRGEFGPLPISGEYEASLLKRIGPAFLKSVELSYHLDPVLGLDYIRLSAQDAAGVKFDIIHDFNLRDSRSPYGQGYTAQYAGPLASPYVVRDVQDVNFTPQTWAGGSDGELYQLESAWNDGGSEFAADWIVMPYLSAERLSVADISIQGDMQTQIFWINRLDKVVADMEPLTVEVRRGNEGIFMGHANIRNTAAQNPYIRFLLTSHSADAIALYPIGPPALSDPPHLPLETYGNIWVVRANPSTGQGA